MDADEGRDSEAGRSVTLSDGRRLAYAEYGDPRGVPMLYFHGHPGSRHEAALLAEAAAEARVRLIGIDRPGLGLSDYQPGRRLVAWPADVVGLADQLGLGRFAVVGFSGGGPYALACAAEIPDRLTACGIVSGVGVLSPFVSFLGMWMPYLMLPLMRRLYFRSDEQARASLARFGQRWAAPDQASLRSRSVSETLSASIAEAFRQGTQGAARDGALISGTWGFDLGAISFPDIHLWHGELDNEIQVRSARALVGRLRHCEATYPADDAHISTIVNHASEIVTALAGAGHR
jgi:pimeloyl-ACP methyl ester carboxylesterase